nr:unnamed protein product [Callosobruchus analis]
MSASVPTNV